VRCGQLGVVKWSDSAEKTDANAGEEPACVQQSRHTGLSTDVEEASKDDPAAGDEHGIFPRDDFAQDTGGERSEETPELEDRCEPTRGCGRFDDCREVFREAVHDQTLAQDTLLVSILESTEAGRMSVSLSGDGCGEGSIRREESDEQDFGITLDRVPDACLHVGGHGCMIVMDHGRERLEDSVVLNRVLGGHAPTIVMI
jgi:hypothetical protein